MRVHYAPDAPTAPAPFWDAQYTALCHQWNALNLTSNPAAVTCARCTARLER